MIFLFDTVKIVRSSDQKHYLPSGGNMISVILPTNKSETKRFGNGY